MLQFGVRNLFVWCGKAQLKTSFFLFCCDKHISVNFLACLHTETKMKAEKTNISLFDGCAPKSYHKSDGTSQHNPATHMENLVWLILSDQVSGLMQSRVQTAV